MGQPEENPDFGALIEAGEYHYLWRQKTFGGLAASAQPVGKCIYCYKTPEEAGPLTDEHVIPDGLGGNLLLPEASCKRCQDRIHPAETHLIQGSFPSLRAQLDLRSRKKRNRGKKRRPNTFKIGLGPPSDDVPLMVLAGNPSIPFVAFVPESTERPRYLTGLSGPRPDYACKGVYPLDIMERVKALGIGPQIFFKAQLLFPNFYKAIAKIAHAFAVSAVGLESFEPYLPTFILSQEDYIDYHHVGNYNDYTHVYDGTHYLEVIPQSITVVDGRGFIKTERVLVVIVHLFAKYGTPIYEAVVGRIR